MNIKFQELQANKKNYVAIHIRMTDFVEKIMKITADKVSYEPFFTFIDESNCDNVYLATDNKDTQQVFTKKYGSKVFFYEDASESTLTEFGNDDRFTSAESIYRDLFMCRDADKFMGNN